MQRNYLVPVIFLAILLALASFASPYMSLHAMRTAVREHDAAALSARVDFPALRDSVKVQMIVALRRDMGGAVTRSDGFAAFGAALATRIADPIIDVVVSPAGVMAMLETGTVRLARPAAAVPAAAPAPAVAGARKTRWSLRYRGLNEVAVSNDAAGAARFILHRDGIWRWKLAGLELPDLPRPPKP